MGKGGGGSSENSPLSDLGVMGGHVEPLDLSGGVGVAFMSGISAGAVLFSVFSPASVVVMLLLILSGRGSPS